MRSAAASTIVFLEFATFARTRFTESLKSAAAVPITRSQDASIAIDSGYAARSDDDSLTTHTHWRLR